MNESVFSTDERLLTHLREIEEAAEDVLTDKQEIVDLDRRRNENREALRALDKSCKAHWKGEEGSKTWLAMGTNCFLKLPSRQAKELLQRGREGGKEKGSHCMRL